MIAIGNFGTIVVTHSRIDNSFNDDYNSKRTEKSNNNDNQDDNRTNNKNKIDKSTLLTKDFLTCAEKNDFERLEKNVSKFKNIVEMVSKLENGIQDIEQAILIAVENNSKEVFDRLVYIYQNAKELYYKKDFNNFKFEFGAENSAGYLNSALNFAIENNNEYYIKEIISKINQEAFCLKTKEGKKIKKGLDLFNNPLIFYDKDYDNDRFEKRIVDHPIYYSIASKNDGITKTILNNMKENEANLTYLQIAATVALLLNNETAFKMIAKKGVDFDKNFICDDNNEKVVWSVDGVLGNVCGSNWRIKLGIAFIDETESIRYYAENSDNKNFLNIINKNKEEQNDELSL